jgi:cytochrome c-type biogenesis protein CcmH/NrfF
MMYFLFVMPAVIVGLLIWLVVRYSKRATSVESRLQALSDMKSAGLVNDTEYERQRATILQSI